MKRTLVLSLLFLVSVLQAAGFIDHENGSPYKWKPVGPVTYRVDPGDLTNFNPALTNATLKTMLNQAFSTWTGVSLATGLSFSVGTDLPADVTGSNFSSHLAPTGDGLFENVVNNQVVVLFDEDGTILENMFPDEDVSGVLGLASPGRYNASNLQITAGYIVLKGSVGTSQNEMLSTMVHEIGHLLNLAHSQLNHVEADNGSSADDNVIPTMYPILPLDETALVSLHKDDEFALGYLYPNAATYPAKGFLKGKIVRRNETGVQGVYVSCRNTSSPKTMAVSWISDALRVGNGEYVCGNLDAGTYSVEIEPIFRAINFYSPPPPFIVSEYYNGASESHSPQKDLTNAATASSVTLGLTTEPITVVLNEDGRVRSGDAVEGVTSFSMTGGNVSSKDYFITVPPGAKSATFELTTLTPGQDFDLFGRCDEEFSVAPTADTIYSNNNDPMQAEFFGVQNGGNEKVTLTSSSSPSLQACTYHVVVRNFNGGSGDFSLKMTIEGVSPRLKVENDGANYTTLGSRETVVVRKFDALGDTMEITGLLFKDAGTGSLDQILEASLYEDTDGSRGLSQGDELISQTFVFDQIERTFSFTNLDFVIEPNSPKHLMVAYEKTTSAKINWFLSLALVSLVVMGLKRRKARVMLLGLFILVFQLQCGKSESIREYEPKLSEENAVTVLGFSFGSDVTVDVDEGTADSVKDFFD